MKSRLIVSLAVLTVLTVLCAQRCLANDGFAAQAVGGVVISKTESIAIKSEVLDISCDRIDVRYEFINESPNDQDALVMFPLPPYSPDHPEGGVLAQGQPSGFFIKVDGKSVNYNTTVRAVQDGRDVTAILKAVGFSEKQIAEFPFGERYIDSNHELKISRAQISALKGKGLIDKNGSPDWEIHINYVWSQRFPAKTVVLVEHTYRPFSGEGSDGSFTPDTDLSKYCATAQQVEYLRNLHKNPKNLGHYNDVPGTNVKYVLTTANSWKDGIRDFTLRIRPKTKHEVVSLCFPAQLARITDTLFEARVKNFRPQQELSVYFGNARSCGSNGYGEPPKMP